MAYEIGTVGEGMSALLGVMGNEPYPIEYLPYTEIVGQTGDGRPVEMGPPICVWRFTRLTQWQYNWLWNWWLRQFSPHNETIRIKTRVDPGAHLSYTTFDCIMWRPTSTVVPGRWRSAVEIRFTQLEEV